MGFLEDLTEAGRRLPQSHLPSVHDLQATVAAIVQHLQHQDQFLAAVHDEQALLDLLSHRTPVPVVDEPEPAAVSLAAPAGSGVPLGAVPPAPLIAELPAVVDGYEDFTAEVVPDERAVLLAAVQSLSAQVARLQAATVTSPATALEGIL